MEASRAALIALLASGRTVEKSAVLVEVEAGKEGVKAVAAKGRSVNKVNFMIAKSGVVSRRCSIANENL